MPVVSTASDIKTAVVEGFLNEGRTVKADADRGANNSSKKVLERVIVSVLFCGFFSIVSSLIDDFLIFQIMRNP